MSAWRRTVTSLVKAALVTHVVLTVFENLPDDKLPIKMRLPFFPDLPQWRFFAPNPGIEDLYVFYRTRATPADGWTTWANLAMRNEAKPLAVLWNPGSRVPKALFDMASQVRTLASNGAMFEWMLNSDGYNLMAGAVRDACRRSSESGDYQFMIVASVPTEGADGIKPIMISPELAL
ncbi:hypothetical protein ACIOGZ_16755 [Kitasatospora sp. NPDC088160]|uniref:hypothetical protein n=1 Tax=Kitasatospora sp. NPDC088160 TaxID=3364072 RepID=UPI00380C66A9